MIGDNLVADIEGGRAAGLSTIHLAPSGAGRGLSVCRLSDIPSLIQSVSIEERCLS
ncbi:HAD hydrolase-like protein [Neorhizobium sp. DT-125]|uniref:HAD hydrolase-like protein n=1 Tax=Neorhizobium sp. DT-125 TaxID=3396163 RepID=UPI003F1C1AE5